MKTALVYDRVNKWGGAERVLLTLHEIFPDAPLYTSVYNSNSSSWANIFPKVVPSFLQKIPFTKSNHEFLGAFTPIAFETFDFSRYDLVVSVTSEAAKGIITKPGTLHICYCLTPTRYLWSKSDYYFDNPPSMFRKIPLFKQMAKPFISYLKRWDKIAAQRPDVMIAISTEVKKRIKKYYGRDVDVIYPPVDIEKFVKSPLLRQGKYFLVVNRLTPYKRVDLVIEVFNQLKWPLVIVGTGSEDKRLRKMAKENITFKGFVNEKDLIKHYHGARALIMSQDEDFGIVSVEAQAAGVPVISYRKSGVKDSVVEGRTGLFFDQQSTQILISALYKFDKMTFDGQELLSNAKKFSKERFQEEFKKLVEKYK